MLFQTLLLDLEKYNHPIIGHLRDGLPEQEIKDKLNAIGVPPIPEIVDVFSTCNGIIEPADISFNYEVSVMPFGEVLSLKEAIERHQYDREYHWYVESRFPILGNISGEMYVIETSEENFGMIYIYLVGSTDFDTYCSAYEDYETMIFTIMECYRKKAYWFEDGELNINWDLERDIGAKLNPSCEYWRLVE